MKVLVHDPRDTEDATLAGVLDGLDPAVDVRLARDPEEARAVLEGERVDVALMDVDAELDTSLISVATRLQPRALVVAWAPALWPRLRFECERAGAHLVLDQTVDVGTLLRIIRWRNLQ